MRGQNGAGDGACAVVFKRNAHFRVSSRKKRLDRKTCLTCDNRRHTGRKTPSALLAGDSLYLRDDEPEKHLTAFLKKTAKEYLSAETARIAAIMGAKYVSVSVNGARTRWGSCSYKNGLNFSYRLIYTAKETISYVVTHELAHTFEKNHLRKFWAIVEKYEPRYKELRADLKRHAHYMEIF